MINQIFKHKFDSFFLSKLYEEFDDLHFRYLDYKSKGDKPVKLYYTNFEGDVILLQIEKEIMKEISSELGHYFRHIFQTIKFIDEFDDNLLNIQSKYSYAKNLRAQLSNYEQILLYFNTISPFGTPWLEIKNDDILSSYLIKYKMIKNIPLPLITFGIRPEAKFEKEIKLIREKAITSGKIEELFEWHEIIRRK